MDIQDIVTLIHAVDETDVTNFELKEEAFQIKIDKRDRKGSTEVVTMPIPAAAPVSVPMASSAVSAPMAEQGVPAAVAAASVPGVEQEEPGVKTVTSPMVGTFYRAPGPDADAFVRNGERVDKGQTLCIIEAMKLMNEIESDYAGEIVGILVEDGEMVEFGQPLFKVKVN